MLIVLGCIFIAMIVGGTVIVYHNTRYDDGVSIGGALMIVFGAIAAIIVLIVFLVQIDLLVKVSVIDERIAMYEEQNANIEEQIEAVVKQYQEYESGIMTEIGDKDSYITLVSLYPELKADALVGKQIEVYLSNNESIVALKNQKLNERVYRWWLYFGG